MARFSEVDICNMALANIGVSDVISDINEDTVKGKYCKQAYKLSRDVLLESYDWNFATVERSLGLSVEKPNSHYAYAYEYPANCLSIQKVFYDGYDCGCNNFHSKFEEFVIVSNDNLTGKVILSNICNAKAKYTVQTDDTKLYTISFIEALSWLIASKVAMKLTNKPSSVKMCLEQFNSAVGVALSNDKGEMNINQDYESFFISSRK